MAQPNAASSTPSRCDVVVVGGGPAGTTMATLLQKQGWQVTLLEKDDHPRFHIGESLLPMTMPLLRELGLYEQVAAMGVAKYGAEFGDGDQRQPIYFADALDGASHPMAYQVRRDAFDHLLYQRCGESGVAMGHGVKVSRVDFSDPTAVVVAGVDRSGQSQRWRCRFVVDASGRDTLLARQFNIKQKNPRHQSAALFGHFHGAERLTGRDEGSIGIYWFEHGWFWMIPLPDGVMSVGAVCWPDYLKSRRSSPEAFLWQTIDLCPPVKVRMRGATACGEVRATGNYSYRATRLYGDRYLLIGDAYAFIDPVFSSGVHLAMSSATLGAEAVSAYLRDPASAPAHFARYERRLNRGIKNVSWLIYRFTTPAMRELFMNPREGRLKAAVISILAGDLFRDTPTVLPMTLFKGVYYLTALRKLSASWASHLRRQRGVKVQFSGGTTPQDQY